jgi:putative transposase
MSYHFFTGRNENLWSNREVYCAILYFNPVKHGLVERVRDQPFSTYHRDVRAGRFEEDWTLEAPRWGNVGKRRAD